MYRLLIAEDVKMVRETLARSIPWHELGIALAGAAGNGEEALARLENDDIDLLLTDIGMPRMSGLELIERAQELKPDIRCIILSGLNEFEHARQAIKLQVLDYVLKPIDPAEIARVARKAVESLDKERAERRELSVFGQARRERLPVLAELVGTDDLSAAGGLKKQKLVELAMRYVKEHYQSRELALSDVAAAVGLSEKYTNLLVKEVTGQTINQLIIRLRMEEAARLLMDPANRIYEICDRIGYADQDHFRESFKKQYGLTPTEYRNRLI